MDLIKFWLPLGVVGIGGALLLALTINFLMEDDKPTTEPPSGISRDAGLTLQASE